VVQPRRKERFAHLIHAARPRSWVGLRPAPPAAAIPAAPVATQGGGAAVKMSSAPASQQVEHQQPDRHQGKEHEQVPDNFHH
jgi:hypothetical protein